MKLGRITRAVAYLWLIREHSPHLKKRPFDFFFFESPLLNINQAHRPISALGLQFFTSDLVQPLHFTDESEGTKVKSLL